MVERGRVRTPTHCELGNCLIEEGEKKGDGAFPRKGVESLFLSLVSLVSLVSLSSYPSTMRTAGYLTTPAHTLIRFSVPIGFMRERKKK